MISKQKNFLFIHVPKTGGNSIQKILFQYSEDEIARINDKHDGEERFEIRNRNYDITKHSTLAEYKSVLVGSQLSKLYKFATIRNPWDMLISYYFSPHRGAVSWNRENFKRFIPTVAPLRHYTYVPNLLDTIAQKLKLPIHSGGAIRDIDFLIRYEHLQSDFNTLCNTLKLQKQILPHKNASSKEHYSEYYDDELINLVRRRFPEEIRIGGYQFDEKRHA
tara:strand:+ start:445 stop:1104 length:660 start_codon:yes stop_codon:yes gene_type:complete